MELSFCNLHSCTWPFHTATSGELQQLHPGWRHSTEIPSLVTLMKELHYLPHLWYRLGLSLGIPSYLRHAIEADYRGDTERSFIEVLQLWLRHSPQPTWEAIVEALKDVWECELAAEIEAKYCHSF